MKCELEVIQTLMDLPVYGEDGKPWTAPVDEGSVWLAIHCPWMYRAKIILALLSAGF